MWFRSLPTTKDYPLSFGLPPFMSHFPILLISPFYWFLLKCIQTCSVFSHSSKHPWKMLTWLHIILQEPLYFSALPHSKLLKSFVSRNYFNFSHSHFTNFTFVSFFPFHRETVLLMVTSDNHHVKHSGHFCPYFIQLLSSIYLQNSTHCFKKHFPLLHNLVISDSLFLGSFWHLPF